MSTKKLSCKSVSKFLLIMTLSCNLCQDLGVSFFCDNETECAKHAHIHYRQMQIMFEDENVLMGNFVGHCFSKQVLPAEPAVENSESNQ